VRDRARGDSDEARLSFTATLRPRGGGEEVSFSERSRFLCGGSGWLYASGEVTAEEGGAVLN